MNHTTTTKKNLALIGMLAAITAALTGTIAITIQTAAAYAQDPNGNSIDKENSGTNSKFKQKEKNNCSGFAICCNAAGQIVNIISRAPLCPID
jgi:Na+/H+-dicarboxylate symporter